MAMRGRPRSFDRDAALDCAMHIFWERGFENTSLSDLTTAMGLNPPSLYAAFGSKEALFVEAVERYSRASGDIWSGLESQPTAADAVAHILIKSAEAFSSEDVPPGCMIVLGGLQKTENNAAMAEKLCDMRRSNMEQLKGRLEDAKSAGELPQEADCGALAAYVLSIQYGLSIQARDGASREILLAVAKQAVDAWRAIVGNTSSA